MKTLLTFMLFICSLAHAGVTTAIVTQTKDGFAVIAYGLKSNGEPKEFLISDVKLVNDIENCELFDLKSNSVRTVIIWDNANVNRIEFFKDGSSTPSHFDVPCTTKGLKPHVQADDVLTDEEIASKNASIDTSNAKISNDNSLSQQVATRILQLKTYLETH